MKSFEFYKKYANTPINKRTRKLQVIYHSLSKLEDKMRPMVIKKQKLLELGELALNLCTL